jgi:hypothetical protein
MRGKRPLIGLAALLGLLALGLVLNRPMARVQVRLPDHGDRIAGSIMADLDEQVCMRYIHSVERTPVQGWFALAERGGFRAVKTKTTGTGTGLPNVVPDDRVTTQGQWLVIDEGGSYLPDIPFYYLPLNQLRIEVGGRRIDLETVPPGSRLRITSRVRPLWGWLIASM